MNQKEHQQRHQELHGSLDELVADFIRHNHGNIPSKTTVIELIQWSYGETEKPTLTTDEEVETPPPDAGA